MLATDKTKWRPQRQGNDFRAPLGAIYCEGVVDGAVVAPITAAQARERDALGEQYAVAVSTQDGRVIAYAEIAWSARFARGWHVDDIGRRYARVEFRRLDSGQLFLNGTGKWVYTQADQPEFDKSQKSERWTFTPARGVDGAIDYGARSGSSGTQFDIDPDELTTEWTFGDWLTLCWLDSDVELHELPDPETTTPTRSPWQPPTPFQPRFLDEIFTPGTTFTLGNGQTVTVEVQADETLPVGGGVVIADPSLLDQPRPLRIDLPAGEHRIELAVVRFDAAPTHTRFAAAKLIVAEQPPVSWEMAIGAEDDPVMLGDGEFFGFGVDSGSGAFADADSLDATIQAVDALRAAGLGTDDLHLLGVVTFRSGWGDGSYPVWIGRDANGTVCAVVADLLVVHNAQLAAAENASSTPRPSNET